MSEERELRTLEDAIALLDEWRTAYAELERAYLRLQREKSVAEEDANSVAWLRRHLDPFLPPSMQVAEWRAAAPTLYANIAKDLKAPARRSPFDEIEEAA